MQDVAEAFVGGLLARLGAGGAGHVAQEGLNEIRPRVQRQLHQRDVLDANGGSGRPVALSAERCQKVGLDHGAGVFRQRHPSLLMPLPGDVVAAVELVLELKTSLATSYRRESIMAKDARQGFHQLRLQKRVQSARRKALQALERTFLLNPCIS